MPRQQRQENYFLLHEAESALAAGAGAMSDQSRVISAQFEKILDSLPFYVILVDTDHNIQFANDAFRQTFGMTLEQVQGQYCPKLVHGLEHPYPGCPVQEAIKGGITEKEHFAEEHSCWLLTSAYPTGAKTKEGLDIYFHTVRDITGHKKSQEQLEASENKYRRLFEELHDVIFIASPDGQLQDINAAGRKLLQIGLNEKPENNNLFEILTLMESEWSEFVTRLTGQREVVDYEVPCKRRDGSGVIISINASMEQDCEGNQVIRGIMRDLTLHRELEQQTTIDELTSLYNRGFFKTYLKNKVRHIHADATPELSVLFIDIDDFKNYNDTYGHQEGDYILGKVSRAIMTAIRGEDVASRYGGEEFTIILACGFEMAAQIAQRIRVEVEDSCAPFVDRRIHRTITVSIGVASLGRDAETAEKLVQVADARMYEAKKLGKNRVCTTAVKAPDTGAASQA